MQKKTGLTAAALLMGLFLLSGIASAEEQYQTEVSGLYTRTDGDQDTTTITYGISAQMFFAPVRTDEHPYAEAAFLERVGSITVTGAKDELKMGILNADGPLLGIELNLVKPDFPLAIDLLYNRSKFDFDAPFDGKVTSDVYRVRIGSYFTKTFLAGVEYLYASSENDFTGFPTVDLRNKDYALFAKYVHELGHFREISLEATAGKSTLREESDTFRNTVVSLLADYYFNKSVSVGAGFKNSSGTDEVVEGRTYSANVRYFIVPQLSLQLEYERFLNSNSGAENEKGYAVTVAGRF